MLETDVIKKPRCWR